MRIDILDNDVSQYEVLRSFAKGLQAALHRAGIRSTIYSKSNVYTKDEKGDEPRDLTVGFNVVTNNLFLHHRTAPHLTIFVDWCFYSETLFTPESFNNPLFYAGFVDEDSCGFMRELSFQHSLFIPHAIDPEAVSIEKSEEIMNAKRDIEVLVPASYIDIDDLYANLKKHFSDKLIKLFEDTVEETLASPSLPIAKALVIGLRNNRWASAELDSKKASFLTVATYVERLMRGLDKIRLLRAIKDVPVHIVGAKGDGEKWKSILGDKENFIFCGPTPFEELPQLMRRSRIVLNSMPMFKRALHERILYAFANGASVISSMNVMLPNFFDNRKGAYYYTPPDYDFVNEQIGVALANEGQRLNYAMEARETVRNFHTWDMRIQQLVDFLAARKV